MRGLQSLRSSVLLKVFNLFVLVIEECSFGSSTGEVTAFAVNHDAAVLISELAHRVRAFGDAHVADFTDERGGLVIEQSDVGVGCLAAIVESKPSPNAQGARRRLILSQSPSAQVYDMNSIIADLAVTSRPEPVPFVAE